MAIGLLVGWLDRGEGRYAAHNVRVARIVLFPDGTASEVYELDPIAISVELARSLIERFGRERVKVTQLRILDGDEVLSASTTL